MAAPTITFSLLPDPRAWQIRLAASSNSFFYDPLEVVWVEARLLPTFWNPVIIQR